MEGWKQTHAPFSEWLFCSFHSVAASAAENLTAEIWKKYTEYDKRMETFCLSKPNTLNLPKNRRKPPFFLQQTL